MSVKIRLARIGKKHVPFFRIVAIDTRKKRDGQNLANLGTYDPIGNKLVQFNQEGINEWVSKGAQLTDTVEKLQKMFKLHGLNKAFEAPKVAPKKEAAASTPEMKAEKASKVEAPAEKKPKKMAEEASSEE
ncbi:30S ribosomal protein S16 [candidate division TM6 bacterium RIFCSPHIGHO2_12_FULL_36_22]|nr:MAG: 30S ribosomal protein S16 [candidate division TM6 bacterium RIFCSPHIGHO2_12_FULL_36_22]